jgi:hypothetical protein
MVDESTKGRDQDRVKTTIVTSADTKDVLTKLKDSGFFESNTTAFRFAVSYAISNELEIATDRRLPDTSGLTWGTTQMDPDGLLRQLIEQIHMGGVVMSQKEAYVMAELLAEAAAMDISKKLERGLSVGQLVID